MEDDTEDRTTIRVGDRVRILRGLEGQYKSDRVYVVEDVHQETGEFRCRRDGHPKRSGHFYLTRQLERVVTSDSSTRRGGE